MRKEKEEGRNSEEGYWKTKQGHAEKQLSIGCMTTTCSHEFLAMVQPGLICIEAHAEPVGHLPAPFPLTNEPFHYPQHIIQGSVFRQKNNEEHAGRTQHPLSWPFHKSITPAHPCKLSLYTYMLQHTLLSI